jgi:hypothetical protein
MYPFSWPVIGSGSAIHVAICLGAYKNTSNETTMDMYIPNPFLSRQKFRYKHQRIDVIKQYNEYVITDDQAIVVVRHTVFAQPRIKYKIGKCEKTNPRNNMRHQCYDLFVVVSQEPFF